MTVYLPSQHASQHDLPDDRQTLRAVLADAVRAALLHQQADGNFEDPAEDDDIGDMSLGVISLLCVAWHQGVRTDEELVTAVRRGVTHFLAERVYRKDNPGQLYLRRRDSAVPYARYFPTEGAAFGDWPSTAWAMLHAVNVLDFGEGLLTEDQYAEVTELAIGYWRWLTEVSMFNPQQTANQAIGAIVGGLTLARHLRRVSRAEEGNQIADEAMSLYHNEIRPNRILDRGYLLPLEHGAGHDQNYLPISLSFLARAYQISGAEVFVEDGDQIARHLDCRLSVRGFDFGGPRYSEQHCGSEGRFGLRYFSGRIGADLGRYLGDLRVPYYPIARNGAPSGHFAFVSVWLFADDAAWYRQSADVPVRTAYSLRHGRVSVSLTESHTPYLIDAGNAAVIESVIDHQHGIAPLARYTDGHELLLSRPVAPVRTRDAQAGALVATLVTKAVVTRDRAVIAVQQAQVTDGANVHLIAVLDRTMFPSDVELAFAAGLPYVYADGDRQRKIGVLSVPDAPDFDLGRPDAVLRTSGPVRAGELAITSAAPLSVLNPPAGEMYFNSPQTIGLPLELASFAIADDPRGFGNPDSGWQRIRRTNLLLADPVEDAPADRAVFALRYGTDTSPYTVHAESTSDGVLVWAPGFAVLVGHPAGDAHGEPVLALSAG